LGSLNHYHNRICQELSRRGILYMEEYTVGQFSIDIYLPEFKRLVEIDGWSHGLTKGRDKLREQLIVGMRPDLHFVRIKVGTPVRDALERILRYEER